MPDPVIGSVGAALTSAVSNVLLRNSQREYDRRMIAEERAYNAPQQQVRRLRQAGINPALALTNGSMDSGNVNQSAGGQSIPQYDFSPVGQAVTSSVELAQQKRLQDAEIRYQDSNTIAQNQRNVFGLQNSYIDTLRNIAELKKLGVDTDFLEKRASYLQKEINAFDERNGEEVLKIRADRMKAEEEAASVRLHNAYQEIVNQYVPKQQQQLLKNLQATEAQILSSVRANDASAAYTIALEAITKAQKEGVDIDNDVKDRIADAMVDKAYQESDYLYYQSGNEAKQYYGGRVGHELPLEGFSDKGVYNGRVIHRQRPVRIPGSKRK